MIFRIRRLAIFILKDFTGSLDAGPFTDGEVLFENFGFPPELEVESEKRAIICASTTVDAIPEHSGELTVPKEVRRQLEYGLESYLDLLSIIHACAREIASPRNCLLIEPLSSQAESLLTGKRIHVERVATPIRMRHHFDLSECRHALKDRLDGLNLLAESLSHEHPTGRLHEFMRLFERAFALPAGRICRNELHQFLSPNGMGYTQDEVEHWLELRDSTAHADRKATFALRSDTFPVENRAEQAAYDVLFNKDDWRNSSIRRRNVLLPDLVSIDTNESLRINRPGNVIVEFPVRDEFNAYPQMLKVLPKVPTTWIASGTQADLLSEHMERVN